MLNFDVLGSKESVFFLSLLLVELWSMAKLVVKQSAKAHGPLVISLLQTNGAVFTLSLGTSLSTIHVQELFINSAQLTAGVGLSGSDV